ncbi:histone-fold-containing protein [Metschnikowia bicuspidata var. bicuspidata NRRL YB-4993]|uniref:Histone-fold-containing protein n=1 Tax=Metschnikowia bicuspidata var. bicuspidata NRRL YB-4993 TaxID=869754 RepID=A0A1A0HA77_9ASCO|nr:histone-fold-containing protein [Metschnikowia bicuspidata var. bicuspidata NRRL YB-4993]OBA20778.1 histone-fold-containing protein [Metschnikowia bicuspidata var. bicuspidata NRRL YB-4993]
MSDSESIHSDVSLDEEDEELIWRVFYSPLEEPAAAEEKPVDFDEDFSDFSDVEDQELVEKYRRLREQEEGEIEPDDDEKKRLLITSFSNDQMERFEAYRRMAVNKPGVKKICNSVLGHLIPQNIAVVMAGLSKLLLGDVITKAFEVQQNEFKTQLILDMEAKKKRKRETLQRLARGEDVLLMPEKNLEYLGDHKMPLTPEHIHEAWRLYRLENSGTFAAKWRTQGEGDGLMFR